LADTLQLLSGSALPYSRIRQQPSILHGKNLFADLRGDFLQMEISTYSTHFASMRAVPPVSDPVFRSGVCVLSVFLLDQCLEPVVVIDMKDINALVAGSADNSSPRGPLIIDDESTKKPHDE
jgi:hypothetical protein